MTASTTQKRWNIAPQQPGADALAAQLKVSSLVAQILLNRGIDQPDSAAEFLKPNLKFLHEPSLISGLDRAAERIAKAVREKEKIVVYGDYDVDGITAVSILWHALRTLGADVRYYIPHRLEEGYGLNADAVAEICDAGAQLIITVDCGVTAIEPAKIARQRRVDLIITDHHEWKHSETGDEPLLPDVYAIVHPRLGGTYPNPNLCGAGVAFKLAWGIGKAVVGASRVGDTYRAFLLDATALAALGTIADVVPLVGENRVIAAFGLGGLQASKLTGIRALIESAQLTGQALDSYHVGFRLGPRLNASGRMGHAKLAVEMLTEAIPERAMEIANYLEEQNKERQRIEKTILEQAVAQATLLGCDKDNCRAVVLGGEGWHPGVIGIVASRIVERFHRPTVMIAINDGLGSGSCRSISGFHLAEALDVCDQHLETHGGHEMAAGLKIKAGNLVAFREAFCAHACSVLTADQLRPQITLEASASLAQITPALIKEMARLGPFGQGNRRPLVCVPNVQIANPPRRVGSSGSHLQLLVKQGSSTMGCIMFNAPDAVASLPRGAMVDLAVEPQLNEYNGYVTAQLRIEDVRECEAD
jgi:single-stranded-DNA-specific exonuclease